MTVRSGVMSRDGTSKPPHSFFGLLGSGCSAGGLAPSAVGAATAAGACSAAGLRRRRLGEARGCTSPPPSLRRMHQKTIPSAITTQPMRSENRGSTSRCRRNGSTRTAASHFMSKVASMLSPCSGMRWPATSPRNRVIPSAVAWWLLCRCVFRTQHGCCGGDRGDGGSKL